MLQASYSNMAGLPPEKPYDLKRGKFSGTLDSGSDSADPEFDPNKDAREMVKRARIPLTAGSSGAAAGSRALADVGVDTQQIDSPLSSPVRPAVTEEDIRKEFEE